jgi:hypothetical protein
MEALDDNLDGQLAGSELKNLSLWNDRNEDGLSQTDEIQPLAEFDIISLSVRPQLSSEGIFFAPAGARLSNGTALPTYDFISTESK